jgi:pimeloyl-ACP methyl ester carboxylesterase
MKFVQYQQRKVAYQSDGKGEPVVLLHGFCEDSRVWLEFAEDLIEEQFRVIVIDLPGFGESETAAEPSIDYYAGAVLAVLDELGLARSVLIGHSMGGYVGLAIAEKRPDRLKGLGLFHAHPFADSEEKKANRAKSVEFIQRQGHLLYVKQLIPQLFNPRFSGSHPFLIDTLIHRAARYTEQGIVDALHAMIHRPDRSDALRRAAFPVLFIVGREDSAVPWEYSIEQTHLPAVASVHLLDKVGHMGMYEATRPTQLIVRQFVDFCLRNPSV